MADTEAISVVELGIDDTQAALLLSTEAHWNQNEADWRFFLGNGHVFGVRDDGRLIATAALLPCASGNAWISMVLVTANWRRRGIATRVVDQCLKTAAELGFTPWLDATPDGANVYGRLGFTPILQLRRLRLQKPQVAKASHSLSLCNLDQFIACDRRAMGFDRSLLLTEFGARPETRMVSDGHAMALVRNGRTARHVGPLFAETPEHALALVDELIRSETGPLLIDVINSQGVFLTGLVGSGWKIERPFQRMRFGPAATQPEELPYAVAGPEFG